MNDFGKGQPGSNGQDGTDGKDGQDGLNGTDGRDGSMWYNGTDTPDNTFGVDSDLYIDTDDYILYKKVDGAWTVLMTNFGKNGVDGTDGTNGSDGAKWLNGTDAPTSSIGLNGDLYVDTDSFILYQKVNGSWIVLMENFGKAGTDGTNGADGQDGQNGKDGSQWYTGTETPAADFARDGDLYVDTDDYILYQKKSGVWEIVFENFGRGYDESLITNKLAELEEKINTGTIDVSRLSSYQNETIYDKTNDVPENLTWTDETYINASAGGTGPNEIYVCTESYFPVVEKSNYVLFINQQLQTIVHYAFYDKNLVFVSGSKSEASVIAVPEKACFLRFTINKSRIKDFTTFEEFTQLNFEFYKQNSKFYSAPQPVAVIKGINAEDTLINSSVTAEKCKFFDKYPSPNLINTSGIHEGYYLAPGSNPNFQPIDTYVVLANMPVSPNHILQTFQRSNKVRMRFVVFFDEAGNAMKDEGSSNYIEELIVPSNAAYAAVTILASDFAKENIQVQCSTDGIFVGYFEPGITIYKLNAEYLDMSYAKQTIHAYLPSEICVAEGKTIELYNSQICLEASKYHVQWVANGFGRPYERKFSIEGTSNLTGQTKTLTFNLYDDNLDIVYTATSTVKFVPATVEVDQLIIPIGDSLTNTKPWLNKVYEDSDGKIKFRGTQGTTDKKVDSGITHEGRSGAGTGWYNSGTSKYSFNPTNTTLEVKEDENGNKYTENPFWNKATNRFDFDYYCNSTADGGAGHFQDSEGNEISIAPTGVQIYLGTNGISLDSSTAVSNITNLINYIRVSSKGATIPIYVVNTLFRPEQIFGVNSDGYSTNDSGEFPFRADLKIMNLETALYDALKSINNVYFVPVAATHDSEYNFPYTLEKVNPYSEDTFKKYTDCVHPTAAGYYQMADIMYSTIAAHYNGN